MTKRKLRINPVDLLIFAVLVAAVVLVLRIFGGSQADGEQAAQNTTVNIEYVVEITGVDENIYRTLAVGQTVEDSVTRRTIGVLKAFSESPMEKTGFDVSTNEAVYAPVEGVFNLTLTISAEAVESASAFTVDSYEVRVGKQISLILPEFQGNGYCVSLTKRT